MESFRIDGNRKYVVYGAGGNCRRIQKLFQTAGYDIVAILDKRADEIHDIDGTPVYDLRQFVEKVREESVIIVSIKNVFEQVNIARILLEQGYRNIIYKSLPALQGEHDEEWDSIDYAYELIVEKGKLLELEEKEIACSRKDHLIVCKDELRLKESADQVMCWIPVELVCNYNRTDAFKLLPMGAYYPLVNLYQYLLGHGMAEEWEEIRQDFFLYAADWVERSGNQFSYGLKKSMLDSRINIFHEMQKKADIDKEFFARNAVSVERESFCFYLSTSGRNRISYLIAKGDKYVPAYMSKADYAYWINKKGFEELKAYFDSMGIDKLFTVIPHPMMLSYMSDTTDYVPLFCMPVVKEIYRMLHWKSVIKKNDYFKIDLARYEEEKAGLKICVAMADQGYMGRMLLMYGLNCLRVYRDGRQKEISSRIDKLFHIKEGNTMLPGYNPDVLSQCQILIADSRMMEPLYDHFGGNMVFVLQWENENEQDNWQGKFANRKLLFRTIWQEKKVAGWKLTKQRYEEN